MEKLQGVEKHHDWGSHTLIPEFLGRERSAKPVAELWFGAHPLGPAQLPDGTDLRQQIEQKADLFLGPSTQYSFGDQLPYLVKLLAPQSPLSIQVHPGRRRAAEGFEAEETHGPAISERTRVYQDATHKPEMIFALTEFDALIGFAVRRQAKDRLDGLESRTAGRLSRRLLLATGRGIKPVVSWILDPKDGPTAGEVNEFVDDCAVRLALGNSPAPRTDQTVINLRDHFGPDPAILIAFLMNHVRLQPGEAAFLPTGTVHSYQNGLGLEVMANSDNVIRAGLTSKHVAADLFVDIASFDPAPPVRLAPEHPLPGIDMFRSPVEDFEMLTATVGAGRTDASADAPLTLPGSGPRIAVCIDGRVQLQTLNGTMELTRGSAAFLRDEDGPALLSGKGKLALCAVP